MPEAIHRSTASQIASYGPPEPRVSQGPTAAAAGFPSVGRDLPEAPVSLERVTAPSVSYEKCIAEHERVRGNEYKWNGAAAGCVAGVVASIGKGPPPVMAAACTAAAIAAYMAAEGQGIARGRNEGALACDELPKKP